MDFTNGYSESDNTSRRKCGDTPVSMTDYIWALPTTMLLERGATTLFLQYNEINKCPPPPLHPAKKKH